MLYMYIYCTFEHFLMKSKYYYYLRKQYLNKYTPDCVCDMNSIANSNIYFN